MDGVRPQGVRIRPLVMRLLLVLVVPVTLAFLLDAALGTSPWIVIVTSVICIPLASWFIITSALGDLNALIAVVAPPETVTIGDLSDGTISESQYDLKTDSEKESQ